MPLPTPDTLREHYGADEFSIYEPEQIEAAIERAHSTVSRYVPAWPDSGSQAAGLLYDCVIKGARAYVHDEARLPDDDPVIRDWNETLSWLRRVGSGQIRLPGYGEDSIKRTALGATVRTHKTVFTESQLDKLQ